MRERSSLYNVPTAGPRTLAELSLEGATLATFTHPDMVEPVAVAVAPRGEFVVADNVSGLLVFDPCGKAGGGVAEGCVGSGAAFYTDILAVDG